MSIDLSQFIPTFLEESVEGLELMESSLLELDQESDSETINSIFRAAHSIKGGAGTFGFNDVTEFTHLVETLLDEMRDGRRKIDQDDVEVLLDSVDCMRLMIEAIRDEVTCEDDKIAQTSILLEKTLAISSHDSNKSVAADSDKIDESARTALCWQIRFIPQHHLVQTGNDPLLLFNALSDLGELSVFAKTDDLPSLSDMDAEELYLTWKLELISDCSEEDIKEVFEWVEDECELIIEQKPQGMVVNENVVNVNEEEELPSDKLSNEIIPSSGEKTLETKTNDSEKVATKAKPEVGSIRVGVDKVDGLINLVGELVITQSMLSELGNDFEMSKVERLVSGLEQLLQNTKELQESVMRIRMLPISFAFNRFPRLVHDLSKKTGKEIELIISGEQTELDKTVMEQIGDPLVHLVRNAADHGIESADIRIAAGKPAKGTITLDAYHQGGNIVIEVCDDGAGINRDVIFAKAVEKNLIDAKDVLSDSQVYDLLFEAGFSTAAEITDISGRGVGMDVVKRNIQSLGGRIQVESVHGKGSTFKVHLPLTLAILDGQLVKVGSETYIIPLIAIVESLQVESDLINRVSGDMVLYRLREDNVPVLPIYQLFELSAECKEVDNALLVVVEADGQKVGLMVDDLLAQQQVVIKSLG